jgi:hypothetical protein
MVTLPARVNIIHSSAYFCDLNLREATVAAVSADIAAARKKIFGRQVGCESGV